MSQCVSALPRAIVLRAKGQSASLTSALDAIGIEVSLCPMIEIVFEKDALKLLTPSFLAPFTTVIFTSVNGVTAFFQGAVDSTALTGKKILAVGPKTAHQLKSYGLFVDAIPEKFNGDTILNLFPEDLTKEHILIPRAIVARQVLPSGLKERGATVFDLGVYRTVMPDNSHLTLQDGDMVIFTSSSTVDHFFKSSIYQGQKIVAFCIGERTYETLRHYFEGAIYTSDVATIESLIMAIKSYLTNIRKWKSS